MAIPKMDDDAVRWAAAEREADYEIFLRGVAQLDAMRDIRLDDPDPVKGARYLRQIEREGLLMAYRDGSRGWRVPDEWLPILRPLGIVGYNGPGLTAYGWKVREIVLREEKEDETDG